MKKGMKIFMVDIYSIQVSSCSDRKIIDSLMQLVSVDRREKIKKKMFQQDSFRCLFGDLLSRYAICKRTGFKNRLLKFGANAHNKPILLGSSDVQFNVSHSGNWVVCAVSNEIVGIDVEHIKPIDFDIAKRFFAEEEYISLIKQDCDNILKYFYQIWTLKESYIKADGRGLSLPLTSFSINIRNDEISVITDNELNSCFFRKYDIDDYHISSVCSLDINFSQTIKEINIDNLFQTLG